MVEGKAGTERTGMKKKLVLAGVAILAMVVSGCVASGQGYDKLSGELKAAEEKIKRLENELATAQQEASMPQSRPDVSSALEQLQRSHLALQEQVLQLQKQLAGIQSTSLTRTFKFESKKTKELTWTVQIPLGTFIYYRELPRPTIFNYHAMASDPADDTVINSLVQQVRETVAREGLSKLDEISLILAFAQAITYAEDIITTGKDEYPRFPVETLFEGAGDCEDTSILAAAIFTRLGYDVALLLFEQFDHMGLGINYPLEYGNSWIYEGKRYWYLDASGKRPAGWAPDEYAQTSAYVLPVK